MHCAASWPTTSSQLPLRGSQPHFLSTCDFLLWLVSSSPPPCPEHLLRNQLYSYLQDITTPQTAQAKALTKPSWQPLPHSKPGDSPLTIWLVDQHPLKTVSAKHPLSAVADVSLTLALSLGFLPTDSMLPHSPVLRATV